MKTENQQYSFIPPYLIENILKSSKNNNELKKSHDHIMFLMKNKNNNNMSNDNTISNIKRDKIDREIYNAKNDYILPGDLIRTENRVYHYNYFSEITFDYLDKIYSFYANELQFMSYNNKNSIIKSCLHYGTNYPNAFWDGQYIVFGDGDDPKNPNPVFKNFAYSFDVMAHEYSHGVVENTSPLIYKGQSGALDESFCDIFSVLARQYHSNMRPYQDSWLIGGDLFYPQFGVMGLRSLSAPGSAYDHPLLGKDLQVGHINDFDPASHSDDNGGVHIYSGIPNHAFYLFAMSLGDYAWKTAGKIWFDTMLARIISPKCSFEEFAQATVIISRNNYNQSITNNLIASWKEVGIKVN